MCLSMCVASDRSESEIQRWHNNATYISAELIWGWKAPLKKYIVEMLTDAQDLKHKNQNLHFH